MTARDIATPADVDQLVAAFYARVLPDPVIGFLFTDIARIDLDEHLPKISAFWQQQLLGRVGYRGELFGAHRELHRRAALGADHFHRWLALFQATVDELFAGPVAEAAKARAARIAASMQTALAQRHPHAAPAGAGTLQYFDPRAADPDPR